MAIHETAIGKLGTAKDLSGFTATRTNPGRSRVGGSSVVTLRAMAAGSNSGRRSDESWEQFEEREEREMAERQAREYDQTFDWKAQAAEKERRKLDQSQFRGVVRAGTFAAVHLAAEGPEFVIRMTRHQPAVAGKKGNALEDFRTQLVLVTTKERQIMQFRNPRRAMALLHRMGVMDVRLDLTRWRPEMRTDRSRRRADLAELLSFAHEYVRELSDGKG
jgi:hypothetical protein